MKALGLNEIREKYLKFFETKGHLRKESYSLVPQNDNSLLMINSGMAPLKAYFTGQEKPERKRITTCQKCIRTGDIENVGLTARHGTFLEMLGNFSFGDYFKEEAIEWAWEFAIKELGLDEDRVYISVYHEDDESYEIWNKKMGIPKEKIYKMGKEDNFWEVGIGPCGPCSELYYDKGEKYGCAKEECQVGCDCDRYIEFWNLVFTQFNKNEDGTYSKLKNPNIDTGMGLERIASIMQDAHTLFDVDTLKVIRDKVCDIAAVKYNEDEKVDRSIRIITDHIRSITFMTADGILPSNEGRGYILRRLLRRATRHAKLLGIERQIMAEICEEVMAVSKGAYPELEEKREYILKVLSVEENRFFETLNTGMEIIDESVMRIKGSERKQMDGEEAFKLYDTYGFPVELLKEILEQEDIGLDEVGFKQEMEKQRKRAREAREKTTFMGKEGTVYDRIEEKEGTKFRGYEQLELEEAKIMYVIREEQIVEEALEGEEVSIILEETVFYAESGGQKGDEGSITTEGGEIEVRECIKVTGNKIAHKGRVVKGKIKRGEKGRVEVEEEKRKNTARNHSATHLLQKALREVLGKHVEQAGSQVTGERLRFDFTHFEGMRKEEIKEVEDMVNKKVMEGLRVEVEEESQEKARERGAMALFGEKYGEKVRVVDMGGYSIEMCGGTHVRNTGEIGSFKIVGESGIAAGVRRIEAITGEGALRYYREQEEILRELAEQLKVSKENIGKRVEQYLEQMKEMKEEIERVRAEKSKDKIGEAIERGEEIKGVKFISWILEGEDIAGVREMGDKIKEKIGSGVIVLSSRNGEEAVLVVMATEDVVKRGVNAGKVMKEAVEIIGGKGGGKASIAQGGGKEGNRVKEAIERAREIVGEQII